MPPCRVFRTHLMAKQWASSAFANANKPAGTPGSTKGALHRQLHVDPKKPIPESKLHAAVRGAYGSLAKKRALPVVNVQK